ncbi:MAG: SPOR domain-containing protein [Candidatus Neomarinimicrobiota bacterium]|nr:SPOR domain-containing protein [Candidatus Neomarinimicrobiota bacterium]
MNYICLLMVLSLGFSQDQKKVNFDPDKLKDPEPRWPKVVSPFSLDTRELKLAGNSDSSQIIIEGFRVQVLATSSQENADRLRYELAIEYGKDIYIVFDAPNYKVRIGNFIDRRLAEKLRLELINKGYPSSWIIRTRIEPNI